MIAVRFAIAITVGCVAGLRNVLDAVDDRIQRIADEGGFS